ncbi:hypothetical protein T4D_902 [Trichinella pseudospiralis]|uniref:Uncharacterized protein n=1 Tax=Trichinella pseudospiralis TaxID=6337 RepID=A0A0V1FXP9_TRIPS|nr:hypothetical protein T4D_902 [Trichinella pseudospiralis]
MKRFTSIWQMRLYHPPSFDEMNHYSHLSLLTVEAVFKRVIGSTFCGRTTELSGQQLERSGPILEENICPGQAALGMIGQAWSIAWVEATVITVDVREEEVGENRTCESHMLCMHTHTHAHTHIYTMHASKQAFLYL